MKSEAYLPERVQSSSALSALCGKVLQAADYLVDKAMRDERENQAVVSEKELYEFGIDANHDYAAMDALAELLCEYPEVLCLDIDDGYSFDLEPDACALYRNLPVLIRHTQDADNGNVYVTWPEAETILRVELSEDCRMRDVLFRALDACPEPHDFFMDEQGLGIELSPQLCDDQTEKNGMIM